VNPLSMLSAFCANDTEEREHLRKPFRIGDFAYATNGHFIVRAPADAPELSNLPQGTLKNALALFDKWMHGDFQPLPLLRAPSKCADCSGKGFRFAVTCTDCDGDGEFDHGSHTYTCKECDGEGTLDDSSGDRRTCASCNGRGHERNAAPIRIGDAVFQHTYLWQLSKLPGILFAAHGPTEAGAFRFDGGCGLLMPTRE
jgi:hypothetical protein